jgi:hypothetical protein
MQQQSLRFDGSDYNPMLDDVRLTGQLLRIWDVMKSGCWLSLSQIALSTGDPEASVSAQLRHLRKPRFGGHAVEKKNNGNGYFLYRVIPNDEKRIR